MPENNINTTTQSEPTTQEAHGVTIRKPPSIFRATNILSLASTHTIVKMQITEHKTQNEFVKYTNITEEQTAMELMNYLYFCGKK